MLWFLVAGFTAVFLAHTAPFPFLLERFAPSKSLWHVPRGTGPPTIYLMYDDRPNPNARHGDGPSPGAGSRSTQRFTRAQRPLCLSLEQRER
jgi:hypothetical protein